MKKQIITLLCCWFFVHFGISQSITEIQYFFNTDTGFGGATTIMANANSGNLTQTFDISTGSLTGFNNVYFRVKDDQNVWSMYEKRVFYVTDFIPITGASSITAAEYFFNTDPGFGAGTPITVNPMTSNITETVAITLPGSLTGFNSLYIRVKDDLDVWSLYEKRIFFVTDFTPTPGASNITSAEYFFNTDPGFGNGSPITVNANTGNITQTIDINTSTEGLPNGFNSLYIRTKDDFDVWSLYEKRIFYLKEDLVLNIPTITGAEYFYDNDPGFGNGVAASITPTGNPDEYTVDLENAGITCDIHDFYIRLQNSDGTWGLYDYSLGIEIFDNANPTIVVFPNITAELDDNGQASITLAEVDNGTFDDCDLVSVVLNQAQFDYTCADLGINTVTITATDAEAKVSNQNVNISVVDLIEPVAASKNITVQLDANGEVTVAGSQVDNGSTDNCSVVDFTLDKNNFNCTDLGDNIVTLTAIDQSGNLSSNAPTATISVEDNINPTVISKDVTVQLDATGNGSIVADDIDNGSFDNCTINSRSLDKTAFSCSDLGPNIVTLLITDQSGNSQNTTATVSVEDNIAPAAIGKDITLQLDATGNGSIVADDIDNGSFDNCTINSRSLDKTTFSCSDLGPNIVTLSITDQSGNSQNTTASVTVEDNIAPVAMGKDITVDLNGNPSVSITANDVDDGSTDNCLGMSLSIDVDTFNAEGVYPVILTATDSSGNIHTFMVMVTVEDSTLGVDDFKITASDIKIYPNPTDGNIQIITNLTIDHIDIYDLSGRSIRVLKNPSATIKMTNLSSGIYFLKFKVENVFVTKRIIKQ